MTASQDTSPAASLQPLGKRLARLLLGDYELYAVYGFDLQEADRGDLSAMERQGFTFRPISRDDVETAFDDGLRSRAYYAGEDAECFGIFRDGTLVCAQFYWHGERYRNAGTSGHSPRTRRNRWSFTRCRTCAGTASDRRSKRIPPQR